MNTHRKDTIEEGRDKQSFFAAHRDLLFYFFLIFTTVLVYFQMVGHDFINFDDPMQLTKNNHVISGLTWNNLKWAFGFESPCSPLTWFVYTVVHSIFDLRPGAFHLMSLTFHVLSSLMLFYVLKNMTGTFWRSAFVSLLFAVHPINVESVAWTAELNNVLSGLFFMLVLLAYRSYSENPDWKKYIVVLILFELGLLAKSVLMTLPFILFLLDLWPLKRIIIREGYAHTEKTWNRFEGVPLSRLILEKIPLLILTTVSLVSSLLSVKSHTKLYTTDIIPMTLRLSNAAVSYIKYLEKLFWPHGMALLYPYPNTVHLWKVAGACLVLSLLTILFLRALRKYPYYLVGWLWFLGSLVPFLGIIQAGQWAEMADRYAYLPFIGIFIMISWGIPDLIKGWRYSREFLSIAGSGVILVLMAITWIQVGYWKNSIVLFEHVIKVNPSSYTARNQVGMMLLEQGETDKAIEQFQMVLKSNPDFADVYFNLGKAFADKKDYSQAYKYYSGCLQIEPNKTDVHINLGNLLVGMGKIDEAVKHFKDALKIDPASVEAFVNLGNVSLQEGKVDEAVLDYSHALKVDPDRTEVYNNIGSAFARKGNMKRAYQYFEKALQKDPDYTDARVNLERAKVALSKIESDMKQIETLIRNSPQNHLLYLKQAELKQQQDDSKGAIGDYQKALAIKPESIQALYGLVLIYTEMQQYAKALGYLQSIKDIQPDNPKIYYNISCLYAKQNMQEESISWLKRAVDKGFRDYAMIMNDPDLSGIRNTEYVKGLIISANLTGKK
jgi:protein O-mannosyl-transferase